MSQLPRNFKGLIGTKLGMTQVFDANGRIVPVTVVQAGPCTVAQVKTLERDGYAALQLAFREVRPRRVNKPPKGHFAKSGSEPRRHLVELRTADAGNYQAGQQLTPGEVFSQGDRVDVIGVSKGKGFAGVMKRHGFKGLGASHGTERKHRSPGSVGACATPSRVFKGMRMAGHMGHERVTVLNLEVAKIDEERNLLLVRGAVPGPKGGGKCGSVELPDEVFGVQINVPVMHRVVRAQLAAARAGTHSTKTRAEVRGGGKKPWRQKGTGRARQGSIRAPQWTGGGVVFGPTPRDHSLRVNKKEKVLALRSALTDRRAGDNLVVLDSLDFDEPKTRRAVELIEALDLAGRKLLFVVDGLEEAAIKSLRNLQTVHIVTFDQLNTYDVLASDVVVFTRESLDAFLGRAATPDADDELVLEDS